MTPISRERAIAILNTMPSMSTIRPEDLPKHNVPYRERLVATIEAATLDRAYVVERNRLIPAATAIADSKHVPGLVPTWGSLFLGAMDNLWAGSQRKAV